MSRILMTLTLAAFLLPGNMLRADDSKSEWKSFKSTKGGFSVLLPGRPTEQTQKQKTEAGDLELHMQICEFKNGMGVVGIAYADLPPVVALTGDRKAMLGGALHGAAQSMSGNVKRESSIELGAHPGIEGEFDGLSGRATVRYRAYIVNSRLYQVMVIMLASDVDESTVNRVFDSFRILND
jgi:hypothetical protein